MTCTDHLIKRSILAKIEKYGWCEIAHEIVDEIFPRPDPMVNAILAAQGHRPAMTQEEAAAAFFKEHNLTATRLGDGTVIVKKR